MNNLLLYLYVLTVLGPFALSKHSNVTKDLEPLIYKGYEVGIQDYSYACFLHFKTTRPTSCGASLIMVQAVLTAAHCMDDIRIKSGEIHAFFGSNVPKDSSVIRRVRNYEINPKYNEVNGKNNLAVAFLDYRVPLRQGIKKIPLSIKDPVPRTDLFSVGWGKQSFEKLGDFSSRRSLKATKQEIMTQQECSQITGYNVGGGTLCCVPIIGNNHKDDAGNGLVTSQPQILVGVLSYIADGYSVYTGVAVHRDWIIKACKRLYRANCFENKNHYG